MNPIHLKGNLLLIDNSTLSEISACPRRACYKFLQRRQLRKNRAALFFGGAIHKALEVRDLTQKTLVDNEVRAAMVEALIEYYDDADFEDDFRSLDYAVKTIDKYNEVYKFDPLQPIHLPDGELAVELPFALHVGDIDVHKTLLICDPDVNDGQPHERHIETVKVIFTGKIDRICRYQARTFLLDHKTSSMGGPNFFNEFYTALQFRGYKWAVEQLIGEPVDGVIINGIICRPPLKDGRINYDMDRHTIHISDELVHEWHNTFLLSVQEWLGYICNQDSFPGEEEQAFPIRTGQCIGKYGTCEYFDVCSLPPTQRPMMIQSGLYEDHSWSPLEDSAKGKTAKQIDFGGLFDHLT